MQQLTKLLLVCNLLLISCKSHFNIDNSYSVEETEKVIVNTNFTKENEYLFRANISVFGNVFNGIFVGKNINENEQRIALTTDFGNTLFDFSLMDKKVKINYIQNDLNRKIVITTLVDIFQKLMKKSFVCNKKFTKKGNIIWECNDKKESIYLFENENQLIFEQINTKKTKKNSTFAFFHDKEKNIQKIEIQQHKLNIKIILNKI